jgi:hypothetical protein
MTHQIDLLLFFVLPDLLFFFTGLIAVQRTESEDHTESVRIGRRCSTWPKPLLLRIERAFISRVVCVGARHAALKSFASTFQRGAGQRWRDYRYRHKRLETHGEIGRRFSRCVTRARRRRRYQICVGFRRCPCSLGKKAFAVNWSGQPKQSSNLMPSSFEARRNRITVPRTCY